MKKDNKSLLYIGASVLLIIAAIVATAIVSRTKTGETGTPADIRAKAGVTTTLKITGSVSSVDETKGVILVVDVQLAGSESPTNLGLWTVTPPPGFNLASLSPGARLTITIDPATFLASTHTVTATQIIVER